MVPGQFLAQHEFRFIPTLIIHVVISTKDSKHQDKAEHTIAFFYIKEKGTTLSASFKRRVYQKMNIIYSALDPLSSNNTYKKPKKHLGYHLFKTCLVFCIRKTPLKGQEAEPMKAMELPAGARRGWQWVRWWQCGWHPCFWSVREAGPWPGWACGHTGDHQRDSSGRRWCALWGCDPGGPCGSPHWQTCLCKTNKGGIVLRPSGTNKQSY